MDMPFSEADLATLIAGYQRAYGDRVEILPDEAEVVIDPKEPDRRQRITRNQQAIFVRDGQAPRVGMLRLALLLDEVPFAVIIVESSTGPKQFRIAVKDVTFAPSDRP